MSRDVIERIRDRWQKLRLLRSRGAGRLQNITQFRPYL